MLDCPDEERDLNLIVHADCEKGGHVSYQSSSFADATHQQVALCVRIASGKQREYVSGDRCYSSPNSANMRTT